MPVTAQALVGDAIKRLKKAAGSTRKHSKLVQECKALLDNLDEVLATPQGATPSYVAQLLTPRATAAANIAPGSPAASTPTSTAAGNADVSTALAAEGGERLVVGDGDSAVPQRFESAEHEVQESVGPSRQVSIVGGFMAQAPDGDAATTISDAGTTPTAERTAALMAVGDFHQQQSQLASPSKSTAGSTGSGPTILSDGALLPIMRLMRLGVDTGKSNIIDICLDLTHKLIAHRLMQGAAYTVNVDLRRGEESGDEKKATTDVDPASLTPQAQAVELICRCEEIADEGVELQVLRGLLTATCSTTFTVHGQALLLAMRTCYNIFLMSHSEKNQNTAKASLTQMLETVFQRMEANSVMVQVRPIVVADVLGLPKHSPQEAGSVANVVQGFLNTVVMTAAYASGTSLTDDIRTSVAASFNSNLPTESVEPEPEQDSDDERNHFQLARHSISNDAGEESDSPRTFAKKKEDAKVNLLQKDAFLVFRALCKLSIRTSDSATLLDAAAVRGKVLALELLKILLENSGPNFRTNEKFISAIRQYLCLSLLKNSASSLSQVLSLSCSIFLTLMSKFRQALKAEVGVFFPMILLKTMEPQNTTGAAVNAPGGAPPVSATFAYRSVVLRCLREMCQEGQLLVDLFVNYDCDLEGSNLFERMVNGLVKIAQSPLQSADAYGGNQNLQNEQFLRQEALHCLVSVLESMEKWYKQAVESEQAGATEDKEELPVTTPAVALNQTNVDESGEDLSTKRANKLKFQEGVELFNKKPKKGIQLLQSLGMLGNTPQDVATFLAKTEGLNKTMIGDFMGERDELPLKVMHAYVDELEFADLDFDDAIRKFLSGFRLPGEAQKIDRLMEKFAERYLKCNPGSFKSADVAYVLAYSVIMLNTDAHNPQVKKKMTREDFLKNNRGINDGADLAEDFMHNLYHKIVTNEIKMKEDNLVDVAPSQSQLAARGFMNTLLSLMVVNRAVSNEPSDDAVTRTLGHLHEKAKGATFFIATEGETVKPMLDVIWAPMLGALSVLFEEYTDTRLVRLCLSGFLAAVCLTGLLDMTNLRDVFLNSLCSFTHLHSPSTMRVKNALAFKALLQVAEVIGDHLGERWVDVLRCMSRWELLQQIASGTPTDAALFTMQSNQKSGTPKAAADTLQKHLQRLGSSVSASDEPRSVDALAMNESSIKRLQHAESRGLGGALVGKKGDLDGGISEEVLESVDIADVNHVFFRSASLDSEAIVHFVRALCSISLDELRVASAPRVFSLTKIVEIAHFNMTRIRLVWSRIWNVLSEYFIQVGCHSNLSVAMYAVDSLRQLAMKFLERDELAKYTFQNDFLRPFVVVMRQSQVLEIRELIIRCLSQMVLARVTNVKSGWKSMFMVFTTAANDKEPTIVRLAFDTIEKIVREHFIHITETETTTFTDCVNCLIAFTNNPHSLDVALNSIAFLRFCAMKLAEGAIGNMEQLSEEAKASIANLPTQPTRLVAIDDAGMRTSSSSLISVVQPGSPTTPRGQMMSSETPASNPKASLRFTDKEEHVYFWFPLLAGLSELTFDPREQIRNGAMEVLFDTLKFHGHTYTQSFWNRIFDSVLLPIFDHVRAEVTDTTTFSNEHRRAHEDAWLYETCTRCLQHVIDLFCSYYSLLHPLLPRMLDLLNSFICRSHQSVASVGVAAFVRLAKLAGEQLSAEYWEQVMTSLVHVVALTQPSISELITPPEGAPQQRSSENGGPSTEVYPAGGQGLVYTLRDGMGARRLNKFRCNSNVQLLLVQACSEVYASQHPCMPPQAINLLLDALHLSCKNASRLDMDLEARRRLCVQQMADRVPEDRRVPDPPLVRLETDAALAYLSVLLHLTTQDDHNVSETCRADERLTDLCLAILERYSLRALGARPKDAEVFHMPGSDVTLLVHASQGLPTAMASPANEFSPFSPLIVATLRAISCFPDTHFRKQLPRIFPLLARLIRCEYAPPEVQQALGDMFTQRVGMLLQ